MNTAGMIGRFRGQNRCHRVRHASAGIRSSMPGQAFDQYRGSGLDREWARISSGALLIRPARDTDLPEKKGAIIQGYGRHDHFRGQDRSTGSGMPAQAFRSSMPGQAFDQDRGSGLDREWARLSVWRIADRASPRQEKSGEHQGYGGHEQPFSRSRPLPQGQACQSERPFSRSRPLPQGQACRSRRSGRSRRLRRRLLGRL